MITHYGLFWSRREVFWGRQKNQGEMLGKIGAKGAEENFGKFCGTYSLHHGNDLIYVGQAGIANKSDLLTRLREHRKGNLSGAWDRFCWFGREDSSGNTLNNDSLKQLEAIMIAITNPGFNKQSGSFGNAKEVMQVRHSDAEGSIEDKIEDILGLQVIEQIPPILSIEDKIDRMLKLLDASKPKAKKRKTKKGKAKKGNAKAKPKAENPTAKKHKTKEA